MSVLIWLGEAGRIERSCQQLNAYIHISSTYLSIHLSIFRDIDRDI